MTRMSSFSFIATPGTVTLMSGTDLKSLQGRLLQRLKAIQPGSVAGVARRADIPVRHLNRLRAGASLDVRLSTLAKLSVGLGIEPEELIARLPDEPLPPVAAEPAVRPSKKKIRAIRDAQKHVQALMAALEDLSGEEDR